MEDREIVKLFLDRDQRAAAELEAKYGGLCRRVAGNILRNQEDAEEVASDAIFAVWRTVPPQVPKSLLAYTLRIARNRAITRLRDNTRDKRSGEKDLTEAEPSVPDNAADRLEAAETARLINDFLRSRPEREQVMFTRRYFMGDEPGEIAKDLGVSPLRVSDTLYKLKGRLKRYLQERDVIV